MARRTEIKSKTENKSEFKSPALFIARFNAIAIWYFVWCGEFALEYPAAFKRMDAIWLDRVCFVPRSAEEVHSLEINAGR